jgi:hypothetical protein
MLRNRVVTQCARLALVYECLRENELIKQKNKRADNKTGVTPKKALPNGEA